jgi:DNA-binding helix-hairpin-helix protein with protein kinase domain
MLVAGSSLDNLTDGTRLVVLDRLGRGGEGDVWSARDDHSNTVAVKWYHPGRATAEQRERIDALVALGEPDHRFLWPQSVVSSLDDPNSFGYVMPIRPDGYTRFDSLVDGRGEPLRFSALATIGRELAVSFHALHAAGRCYKDISIANVFVHPARGEVRVCDNDNVCVDDGKPTGILGSLYFMAPEVMRRDKDPSRHSDFFSLAVMLFYLLVRHHPLEGRRCLDGLWDAAAQMRAFAYEPKFIFDPSDASNAPDPVAQPTPDVWWPLLPQFLRDLFIRSFTVGLTDPQARVTETVWRNALDDLRASEQTCVCGAVNLRDPQRQEQCCWRSSCERPLPPAVTMVPARPLGRHALVLDPGAILTEVNTAREGSYQVEVARVEARADEPDIRGLRNLSSQDWMFQGDAGGSAIRIGPGRVLRVRNGTLTFGAGHSAQLVIPD